MFPVLIVDLEEDMRQLCLHMILVVLAASLFGSALAQEADTPAAVVDSFYTDYITAVTGADGPAIPLLERQYQSSSYLTDAFIARMDERLDNPEEMGFGADPFLCAQDFPTAFEVETMRDEADQAVVLVQEYFGGPPAFTVTVTLQRLDGAWLIDDITCGDTLTPRGVTEDFYAWYIQRWEEIRAAGSGNLLVDGRYAEYPYLSDELIASVDEHVANREMGGGDPLLCAQDFPQRVWAYEVMRPTDSTALVLAQAFYEGNSTPHNLTVLLETVADQWLITEVRCGVAPQDMAALLYREYFAQVRFNLFYGLEGDLLQNPVRHWNRNVAPELLAQLIAARADAPPADPVSCAQDIPEAVRAEVLDSSESRASVRILGGFPSGPDTLSFTPLTVVTMELVEGQWMMTEIACAR